MITRLLSLDSRAAGDSVYRFFIRDSLKVLRDLVEDISAVFRFYFLILLPLPKLKVSSDYHEQSEASEAEKGFHIT